MSLHRNAGGRKGASTTNLKPIVPSHGKTKSWVDEAVGVTSETRRKRQPRGHLAQGGHDSEAEESDRSVSNKERTGAGAHES